MRKTIFAIAILILGTLLLAACRPGNGQDESGAAAQNGGAAAQEGAGAANDEAMSADVTVTLGSVGTTAWLVTDVSAASDLAQLDTNNPVMALEVGTRYAFENPQARVHPFALQDADGATLLAQGSATGAMEQDENVSFVDDGTTIAFTLTQELADRVARYQCLTHAPMQGSVTVAGSD